MNKYIVKLKDKIFNKHMIVEANNFNCNTFTNTIIFVDKDGRNVALFNRNEVEYVRADMIGQICKLQEENEKLKADLRGKDNEINDLKARIAYLKQFKPKEKDISIRQG